MHRHPEQGGYGQWELIGSSQEQEKFKYTVGFTKSNSESTSKTDEQSMSSSMSFSLTVGIPDEEGITETYSMTAGYTETTTQ